MFTHLKNIETAFKHIRQFSLLLIAGTLAVMGFSIYKTTQVVTAAKQRVYVLYNGKLLEATAADRKINLPVELRDHIRTFHEYFFNLTPDNKQIRSTMEKALNLADESAKRQYYNLQEANYYNNLISANMSQQIQVDSTRLSGNDWPYHFTCYATETLVRSSGKVFRRLVTQGEVMDIHEQSDNNPHGFLIQNWEVLANQDTTLNSK